MGGRLSERVFSISFHTMSSFRDLISFELNWNRECCFELHSVQRQFFGQQKAVESSRWFIVIWVSQGLRRESLAHGKWIKVFPEWMLVWVWLSRIKLFSFRYGGNCSFMMSADKTKNLLTKKFAKLKCSDRAFDLKCKAESPINHVSVIPLWHFHKAFRIVITQRPPAPFQFQLKYQKRE